MPALTVIIKMGIVIATVRMATDILFRQVGIGATKATNLKF